MYKRCVKCRTVYLANIQNFAPRKDAKDGLRSECRVCRRIWSRASCKKYYRTRKGREYHKGYYKRYRGTKEGYLHLLYDNINMRCLSTSKDPKCKSYIAKGIKNKFLTSAKFINYVIGTMQIDPRGLEIHRINNDGHYEKGNIEFLIKKEHIKIHVEIRRLITKGKYLIKGKNYAQSI